VADIEIGNGKSARRGFGLDEISIVPSRRTRDPEEVNISWRLDAFDFELPIIAAPADSVVSPKTAVEIDRLGALATLHLEGLWTRYENPTPMLKEIASLKGPSATRRIQEIYAAPVQLELLRARIEEIGGSGAVTCGAVTPQHAAALAPTLMAAGLNVLVIMGTVVSAEHVSKDGEPLNLKNFIRELDIPVVVGGCASFQAALHLMRTGAVGVLVGVGEGVSSATRSVFGIGAPQATAIADAAGARSQHLEETGVYVQVISQGGMLRGGDIAKAIACGADAVMMGAPLARATEAPGVGVHFGPDASNQSVPRGLPVEVERHASLAEILTGPGHFADGSTNLAGALRSAMALSGYASIREFHKAEIVLSASAGRRS
jgi:IMP dehydrogenase